MRKSMYSMLAMAALMGGFGTTGVMPMGGPRKTPEPRKLSPEEEKELLDKNTTKFLSDLEKHNTERRTNFPKWKSFEVYGLNIVASNQKNAFRDITLLLKQNSLSVAE